MRIEEAGPALLINADCRDAMRAMDADSVDAVVTDPPYGLNFMSKGWDHGVPGKEFWVEALRVAKPGAHLLAFGGTRTFHRLMAAIEDAGWEIRDTIMWVYASGMPKSFNMDRVRGEKTCGCESSALPYTHGAESSPECDMQPVCDPDVSSPLDSSEGGGEVLQPSVQEQGTPTQGRPELPASEVRGGQPCLEGRSDVAQPEGELRSGALCAGAGLGEANGAEGRVHHGASAGDGRMVRPVTDAGGDCASHQPQAPGERQNEPRIMAGQSEPQTSGAWPLCGGCGKPMVPKGLGTALKPAFEPVIVARKPLVGTVAANVQQHGTGAMNIDGCRVPTDDTYSYPNGAGGNSFTVAGEVDGTRTTPVESSPLGRWPANLIHDGSDEVLALFPDSKGQLATTGKRSQGDVYGTVSQDGEGIDPRNDTGSAARFFYCPKTSKKDRNEGCESMPLHEPTHGKGHESGGLSVSNSKVPNNNNHPTVKPTELMRYLCRLVTPPGGTVLDPFMGSGSTGKAALKEGFGFVGIDSDEEHGYFDIACARVRSAVK